MSQITILALTPFFGDLLLLTILARPRTSYRTAMFTDRGPGSRTTTPTLSEGYPLPLRIFSAGSSQFPEGDARISASLRRSLLLDWSLPPLLRAAVGSNSLAQSHRFVTGVTRPAEAGRVGGMRRLKHLGGVVVKITKGECNEIQERVGVGNRPAVCNPGFCSR
jgi:hypothetical protein